MKKVFKTIFNDSIFKQSGLLFVSSVFVNVFNLIFWLYMVRKLAPQDYGVLNSVVSLMAFFSIPGSIIQPVVIRYVSKFMALKEEAEVKSLLYNFVKVVGIFLISVLIVLFAFAAKFSVFLKIDVIYIYIIALSLTCGSFTVITLGALHGMQKFDDVALNNVVSGFVKLVAGIVLVYFGMRAIGALLGFVLCNLTVFIFSAFQMHRHVKKMAAKMGSAVLKLKEVYAYFLPVGLTTFCTFALTNVDIILVKHFFLPIEAGYYSVAQTVGRIVLFAPGMIGCVMFPKVVDSHVKNGDTWAILKKCLIAVAVLCGFATFFVFLSPAFVLKILTGKAYPDAVPLVKYFSLSMSFYALVQILMLYHLSLHRMKYIYTLTIGALLQFVCIWVFHSSLEQVLIVLMINAMALFYLGIRFSQKEINCEKS